MRFQVMDASSCLGEMYFVEDLREGYNYYTGCDLVLATRVAEWLNKVRPSWSARIDGRSCIVQGCVESLEVASFRTFSLIDLDLSRVNVLADAIRKCEQDLFKVVAYAAANQ